MTIDPLCNFLCGLVRKRIRSKTALHECCTSMLQEVSSLRRVLLWSSDDPEPWVPAAVEPSTCSSVSQDLAEPDTLDAEAVNVSNLHIRVVRALKFCSHSVSRVSKSPSVFEICESTRDIHFVRARI